MKKWRVSVCIITFLSTVFSPGLGDVVYLHAHRNSSIEFSCVSPEHLSSPFAFTLSREWLQKGQVLYHNFDVAPTLKDPTFADRISDRRFDKNRVVNVSITQLQGSDTDLYVCMFHYHTPAGFQNLSGRNKFILFVRDYHVEPCSCYSYTPLLFSLSAGAGLLFIILIIIAAVHCSRSSQGGGMKPQVSVPVYEEMNGVRKKASSRAQEDADADALYLQPRKENPYSN